MEGTYRLQTFVSLGHQITNKKKLQIKKSNPSRVADLIPWRDQTAAVTAVKKTHVVNAIQSLQRIVQAPLFSLRKVEL